MTENSTIDENYEMASVEALVAGTMALMTGYAQTQCATNRSLIVRKILTNLADLGGQERMSSGFQTVIQRIASHWMRLNPATDANTSRAATPGESSHNSWHAAPRRLQ